MMMGTAAVSLFLAAYPPKPFPSDAYTFPMEFERCRLFVMRKISNPRGRPKVLRDEDDAFVVRYAYPEGHFTYRCDNAEGRIRVTSGPPRGAY